jgi:hypothetical protein
MASRVENAQRIALEARVFVRKARAEGCTNKINKMTVLETAEVLGLRENVDYTFRTVKLLLIADARIAGETHLLGFEG